MKFLVAIVAGTLLSVTGHSQSGAKLDDNILEYIDSMETHIVNRADTIVKYTVYGSHGEAIQHSFPVQISLNKGKEIVSVTDLRSLNDKSYIYWFNKGKFVVKTKRKQISEDQFDIIASKHMDDIDKAYVEAIVAMSKHFQY